MIQTTDINTQFALAICFGCLVWMASSGHAVAETGAAPETEARLLQNVRQLIFEGRRSGEGYFSSDGKQMIFQSEREAGNPFYQMYLMDLETGDTQRVSTGFGKTTCGWIHPDGNKVLFAATHEDPEAAQKQAEEIDKRATGKASRYAWSFDPHYDIYEADPDGQRLRNLTRTRGYDAEGSWSPDGSLIAFASNRHAYTSPLTPQEQKVLAQDKSHFMEIYLMAADGSGVRRLTETPGYDGGPFFSPNGKRIVWRRFSEDGVTAEVWTMALDGSDKRQITQLGVMSWAPFYHPSGDYIIFTNNRHGYGNFELYLVDAEGRRDPVRVTYTPGFDGLPVFTPDGNRLAWSSKRTPDRNAQIFIGDWNDAEARRVLGLDGGSVAGEQGKTPSVEDGPVPDFSRLEPAITPADLRQHLGYLASQAMEGRLTGSPGAVRATDYVASTFAALGLQPAGDDGSFFQSFEFTSGVSLAPGNTLTAYRTDSQAALRLDQDWRPLAFSAAGDVSPAPVVFAGYGIVAPGTDQLDAYDAYSDLDVGDKWVMVLRYMPEDVPAARRQHLARYFDLHHKAMLARDKGAVGLIVASGPNAGVKEELIGLGFDNAVAATRIAVVSVTDAVADQLLAGTGRTLKALQDALDREEPVDSFAVPGVELSASIRLKHEQGTGRNVLARLPARDSSAAADSTVILGAHVDHIGRGIGFDSLADKDERGRVHPGADDNASGVSALLEIAQYLSAQAASGGFAPKRSILFAAWSGEEIGLLGSQRFVEQMGSGDLWPRVAAYLNMDMVGHLDQRVYLQGAGSSPEWAGEIERRNAPIGLPVVIQQDTYLPTDATTFYLRGVPILNAFTGAHEDYNTPRDTAEGINYEGTARIARLMALLARGLSLRQQAPTYVAVEKPTGSVSRRNLRAYLGTIPAYGETDVKGVKLNGVAKGGPADKGGLMAGDVIVALAGHPIESIYDYTYALNALKVGTAVEIIVKRGGERVSLSVTPGSRE